MKMYPNSTTQICFILADKLPKIGISDTVRAVEFSNIVYLTL